MRAKRGRRKDDCEACAAAGRNGGGGQGSHAEGVGIGPADCHQRIAAEDEIALTRVADGKGVGDAAAVHHSVGKGNNVDRAAGYVQPVPIVDDYARGVAKDLDALVQLVSDKEIAVAIHRYRIGRIELTGVSAIRTPLAEIGAAVGKLLDAMVATVGDIDVAVAVHGHAGRVGKLPGAVAIHPPGRKQEAVAVELLNTMVERIRHIDIAAAVHGHAGRAVKLAHPAAQATPLRQVAATAVKLLDAMVERIRHINIAAAVHGHAIRRVKLPDGAAAAAPLGQITAVAVEFLHTMERAIRDINIAAAVYCHAAGYAELPIARAAASPLEGIGAGAAELLDALVPTVSDIEIAAALYRDAQGLPQQPVGIAQAADGGNLRRRGSGDAALNDKGVGILIVVVVGDADGSCVDAHAAIGGKRKVKGAVAADGYTVGWGAGQAKGAGPGATQRHHRRPAEGQVNIAAVLDGEGSAATPIRRHCAKVGVIGAPRLVCPAGDRLALALQIDLGAHTVALHHKGIGGFIAVVVGNAHCGGDNAHYAGHKGEIEGGAAIAGGHATGWGTGQGKGAGIRSTQRYQRRASEIERTGAAVDDRKGAHDTAATQHGAAKVSLIGGRRGAVAVYDADAIALQVDFRRQRKDIGGPRRCGGVVVALTIDGRGVAVFLAGAGDDGIAGNGHDFAKIVRSFGVGRFEIGLLAPGAAAADKEIGRAGVCCTVIAAVAVDAGGITVFVRRANDHAITGHGHGGPKAVAGPAVGGLEVGLLAPRSPGPTTCAHKDIGRTGSGGRIISAVAIDGGGIAVL